MYLLQAISNCKVQERVIEDSRVVAIFTEVRLLNRDNVNVATITPKFLLYDIDKTTAYIYSEIFTPVIEMLRSYVQSIIVRRFENAIIQALKFHELYNRNVNADVFQRKIKYLTWITSKTKTNKTYSEKI